MNVRSEEASARADAAQAPTLGRRVTGPVWRGRINRAGARSVRLDLPSANDPRGHPVASRGSRCNPQERIALGAGAWELTGAWCDAVAMFGLCPADEVGPCVIDPFGRLAALSHGMVDLAPFEADIAQHAVVETGQGVHGAAGGQFLCQLSGKPARSGHQTAQQRVWP